MDCIDLGSDSEDEEFSSSLTATVSSYKREESVYVCIELSDLGLLSVVQLEDKISCEKARVASILDRLEQKVAQDKEERANKLKAFKVSWVLL